MDGSNDVSQLNFKELFQAHSNKESINLRIKVVLFFRLVITFW